MKAPFDSAAFQSSINRRTFLGRAAYGLGGLAFASLLDPALLRGAEPTAATIANNHWRGIIHPTHFPVRAKRIIHLYMAGGPSHLESFDYKPKLKELDGKPFPESFTNGQQLAQLQGAVLKARGPFCEFTKQGKSGLEISSLFPHIAGIADDLCVIK